MGSIASSITGIGKDKRKAQPTPVSPGTAQLSAAMEEAIIRALNQDISFSAENQAAFREDRPFVREMLDEDRAVRNAAFDTETQYAAEDRETAARLLELGLEAFGEDRGILASDRATRDAVIDAIAASLDDISGPPIAPAYEAPGGVELPGAPRLPEFLGAEAPSMPTYTPPAYAGPGAPQRPAAPTMPTVGAGPAAERVPTLDTLIAQIDEALKTGGVGAQMPIISRATEASRRATSSALSQLDEQLAATGLGRSSYGMRNRGDILLRGEQATADIGPRIAQQFVDLGAQILPGVEAGRAAADRGSYEAATQRFVSEADAVLKRYGLDLDSVMKQYGVDVGAAVQKYGIASEAELQRFKTLVDSAMRQYGIDMGAEIQRYSTETDAVLRQYGIDVGAEMQRYGTDVDAATRRYGTDVGRYGTELTTLAGQESDLLRALVALTSGVSVPGTPTQAPSQAAPSPQQLLGFGLQAASPSPFLNVGPTGASLVSSGVQRGVAGAQVAAQRDTAEWAAIASIYKASIEAAGSIIGRR